MSAALRAWWRGLSRRERATTAAAAALVALALVYALAVEPAWKARERLEAELPRLREQAAELDALALEAKALRGRGAGAGSAASARRTLEQSLAAARLGAASVGAPDERRLSVTVKNAPADSWLAWVEQAARETRLRVAAVQVSRNEARGVIDAQVTFEAADRP